MKQRGLGTLTTYLPYGYGKSFSQRYGCSVSKIYKVVVGKLVDYRILEALKKEAEANLIITQQIDNKNKKIKR
jgi:uncharacterized membrane protein